MTKSADYHLNKTISATMKKYNPYLLFVGLLVMFGAIGVNYLSSESVLGMLSNTNFWIAIIAASFLIISFIATFQALDAMKYMIAKKEGRLPEEDDDMDDEPGFIDQLLQKLQDSKPIEAESEIDLDHDYDGIRELDNNLPPWWLYGFYITIVFSVIYLLRYHVFHSAPLQLEEYKIEMAEAEEAREAYLKTAANMVDENSVVQITEGPRLEAGASIYKANCAVCHAADGGGGVGPNFTDSYWIHGGDIKSVFSVVKYGVPSKGMIAWKDQLNPEQMQNVSSYILSLVGTEAANPKEPQGDLFEAPSASETDSGVDDSPASEEAAAGEEAEASNQG